MTFIESLSNSGGVFQLWRLSQAQNEERNAWQRPRNSGVKCVES
jgi:hypothetical protein